MKNFKNSDYAANKHRDSIAYRFSEGVYELTLEAFLASDPSLTPRDFRRWKRLSDLKYLRQVRDDNAQTKKDSPVEDMEGLADLNELSLDEGYIEMLEERKAYQAIRILFSDGSLTAIQSRRFRMSIFKGMTTREIAKIEGVSHVMVAKSIRQAKMKLKKIFENMG